MQGAATLRVCLEPNAKARKRQAVSSHAITPTTGTTFLTNVIDLSINEFEAIREVPLRLAVNYTAAHSRRDGVSASGRLTTCAVVQQDS